jgi:hypothetical protein
MNHTPNIPGEIFLGEKEYSLRADWRVNGWLLVATLVSAFSDILFPSIVKQWPLGWRAGIVLVQFLAIALWAGALMRWIRGMDEMHRRITVASVLSSISATFFCLMLWHRLDGAGVFIAAFGSPKPGGSWDICTLTHGFLLLTFFYFVSFSTFNRRYR